MCLLRYPCRIPALSSQHSAEARGADQGCGHCSARVGARGHAVLQLWHPREGLSRFGWLGKHPGMWGRSMRMLGRERSESGGVSLLLSLQQRAACPSSARLTAPSLHPGVSGLQWGAVALPCATHGDGTSMPSVSRCPLAPEPSRGCEAGAGLVRGCSARGRHGAQAGCPWFCGGETFGGGGRQPLARGSVVPTPRFLVVGVSGWRGYLGTVSGAAPHWPLCAAKPLGMLQEALQALWARRDA